MGLCLSYVARSVSVSQVVNVACLWVWSLSLVPVLVAVLVSVTAIMCDCTLVVNSLFSIYAMNLL